jgi:FMN phosphatase YigB (HAD superfamily)
MRTLLFDFGNVLGFFDHRIAVRQWVRYCDLNDDACCDAIFGTPLEDDYESGRISTEEFIQRGCSTLKYRGAPEHFGKAFQDIFRPNLAICELIPTLAKHYRLVLASNTNDLHATHFRAQYADVLRHFSALGLSCQAGVRKPHRKFYEYCQTLAECSPEECLFVDDLPANVKGAQAFGWNVHLYAGHAKFLAELRKLGIDV